jgi:hypothetical protein
MSDVGFIINQRSSRTMSIVADLLAVAKRFAGVRPFLLDGIDGLDRSLAELNRARIDTLILAGGDGTLQAAFTDSINRRRFDHTPGVVALPCGMTNVIAADCGLKGSPVEALDRFLWRRNRGEVAHVSRRLMGVRTAEAAEPIYGFFLGAGLFHTAVQFSRNEIQAKGAKRSLAMALTIPGFIIKSATAKPSDAAPMRAAFTDLSSPFEGEQELSATLMTTLRRLVLGVYPFWGEGAGPLAVTTIGHPMRRLLPAAAHALRGKSAPWMAGAGYQSWRTNALDLDYEGAFVFDGEIFQVERGQRMTVETHYDADFLI